MQLKTDFERFLLQASDPPFEKADRNLYLGEFSWSVSKHRLFHFCRRAFYFRHILAQGGWNDYSDEWHRQAYIEKYLLYFEDFLQKTVLFALCNSLPFLRETEQEEVRKELLLERMKYFASLFLFRSHQFLREKGMWSDPRYLSFAELYYRDGRFSSCEDLMEEAKDVLRKFFQYFPESEFFRAFALASAPSIRYPDDFPVFKQENITILQSPFTGILAGGALCKYTFSFRQKSAESTNCGKEAIISGENIFALYVKNKYPFYKAKVHTFYMPVKELFSAGKDESIPPFQEEICEGSPPDPVHILQSAQSIREYLLSSGLSAVPEREECNTTKCPFCRFRGICERTEKK